MTRPLSEYGSNERGLYRVLADGTIDPMGARLKHGYTVRCRGDSLMGAYVPQPGDMFMFYEPWPWGWAYFCTWHSTEGEADAVAEDRRIDFYFDLVSGEAVETEYYEDDDEDEEDY